MPILAATVVDLESNGVWVSGKSYTPTHSLTATVNNTMVSTLPVHFFSYGTLLGVSLYQSFYAGITAYKALPYEMFSKLQQKIFPGYFTIQTVLSAALLATSPFKLQGPALYALSTIFGTAAIELFVILPKAAKIGLARMAQMEKEGKDARDPTASDDMKAIHKQFKKMHSVSVLVSMATVIAELYYGAYFVNRVSIQV